MSFLTFTSHICDKNHKAKNILHPVCSSVYIIWEIQNSDPSLECQDVDSNNALLFISSHFCFPSISSLILNTSFTIFKNLWTGIQNIFFISLLINICWMTCCKKMLILIFDISDVYSANKAGCLWAQVLLCRQCVGNWGMTGGEG